MITKKYLDELTYEIIGSAIEVHKIMGRGLLESVYHQCLKEELNHRKINFLTEMKVPVIYKEKLLDLDFRCDLYVENSIVVELKAVQDIVPAYEAQLLTYMKLLKCPKGILINFNCFNIFNEGQKTYVNEFFTHLPNY
ncbi:GxxExxY protein [Empedobacter falsenii]|uniref:GxxExxY protein n=1 Tax=Empedobacter falsenii TaxID=343874 RepID=A0A7H9DWG3_9FLAO|nr:GxxExxY protein [Empedobacter falsenii]MDM1061177.1 GxxExxY protein [Empedobacter falsenii]MDM1546474.1 GxxExxY protein [Empedobacter falsenii]QLL59059.1 GxxExxY protein [Empedobacter falsenii]